MADQQTKRRDDALTIVAYALTIEARRRAGQQIGPIEGFPEWLAHIKATAPIWHRDLMDDARVVLEQLDKAGMLKDTAV